MKRILLFLSGFGSLAAAAQTPYTTLDSLTSRIRKIQLAANSLNYRATDGKSRKLSFSEDNFGVLSYNRLGYSSHYASSGSDETIRIVEDADFSAVSALEVDEAGEVAVVTLKFPRGVLKSTVLENGVQVTSPGTDRIELFSPVDSEGTSARQYLLFALVAELCNRMKFEKGRATENPEELAKKWASTTASVYPASLIAYSNFVREHGNSLYSLEANKRLQRDNERKQMEDRRAHEAAALKDEVYRLARNGDQSFRNYAYYFRADTTAARLLQQYKPVEIGAAERSKLLAYRDELQERYKWNQEYFKKSDKIAAYDVMVQKAATLNSQYMRKLDATVNGSLVLKASLLALGGIATGVGAYATLTKDESFSPALRKNLLMYGGGAFTIGMTWTIAQGSSVKRAGKKADAARQEAEQMKQSIGSVLDKRNETLGQKPLINVN